MSNSRSLICDAANLAETAALFLTAQAEILRDGLAAADAILRDGLAAADAVAADAFVANDSATGRTIFLSGLPSDWRRADVAEWMRRRQVAEHTWLLASGGEAVVTFSCRDDANAALLALEGCCVRGSLGKVAAAWQASAQ